MMKANEKELTFLINSIKDRSRGWIEAIAVISEDGTPLAHNSELEFNPEYVGAATAAICGAISAVIELLSTKGYKRVDIQLEGGRYLLMRFYKGNYLICLTRPHPNLGLINMILEAHLSERGE